MTIRFGFTSKDEPFELSSGSSEGVNVQDEGVSQGDASSLDFTGSGVSSSALEKAVLGMHSIKTMNILAHASCVTPALLTAFYQLRG